MIDWKVTSMAKSANHSTREATSVALHSDNQPAHEDGAPFDSNPLIPHLSTRVAIIRCLQMTESALALCCNDIKNLRLMDLYLDAMRELEDMLEANVQQGAKGVSDL